jgi:hypothetical protein
VWRCVGDGGGVIVMAMKGMRVSKLKFNVYVSVYLPLFFFEVCNVHLGFWHLDCEWIVFSSWGGRFFWSHMTIFVLGHLCILCRILPPSWPLPSTFTLVTFISITFAFVASPSRLLPSPSSLSLSLRHY